MRDLLEPTAVVARAVYESAITLIYLITRLETRSEMLVEVLQLIGHRELYAELSWEAHSRVAGVKIERLPRSGGTSEWWFGTPPPQPDLDAVANHTRPRLRLVYLVVMPELFGVLPELGAHRSILGD